MGDKYPIIKVAAVQADSIFLNREASIEKACSIVKEAGKNGAKIIGFPESFIPGHPIWFHFHSSTDAISTHLSLELFNNSIEVPGVETETLCKAAKDANTYVVIGVCERTPNRLGTLFNTQVFIGPDGHYIGKHQKLVPTLGERLVHTGGYGDTLKVFNTEFGPISGLICGENCNPLAVFALIAGGTRIHISSWPNHFSKLSRPMRDRCVVNSQCFAEMSKACVVSVCSTVSKNTIRKLQLKAEDKEFLRDPVNTGGTTIINADSKVIAGPMGNEEGILYADIDLEVNVRLKLRHDYAGHYNRPDVFQLKVNRNVPKIFTYNSIIRNQTDDVDCSEETSQVIQDNIDLEF